MKLFKRRNTLSNKLMLSYLKPKEERVNKWTFLKGIALLWLTLAIIVYIHER